MRRPALSPKLVAIVGVLALAIALALSLRVGVIEVTTEEVLQALLDGLRGRTGSSGSRLLVLELRLPRALAAACVGAALATAGCLLQALLRDPLASPSIIGTAQAAGFGRVLGVFLGLAYAPTLLLSFLTAIAGTLLVLWVSRARRGFSSNVVLLTGVNVGLLFGALIGLLQYLSRDEGQLSRMVLWLLGGLWQVTWPPLAIVGPATLASSLVAQFLARRLDVLSLGEDGAVRLGLSPRVTGTLVLALACLLTSLAVSVAGIVAFVGLVVPHAARRLVGPAHELLLPASTFLGAVLLVGIDLVARSAVPPSELPLGVLTSLVGVPVFLWLLRSLAKQGSPA